MSTDLHTLLTAFDPDLPLERAHTIPGAWYHDPAIFDLERRAVFGNTWQAVGRTTQVLQPGSFLTADVAGEPVAVVCGPDGIRRAFSNVCRHRGARVVCEPEGKATRLRCHYHGWTYDLAGRLRGTPEFEGVAEFQREEQGLPPLAVDVWGPLVFVHLGKPVPALADFLTPLPELELPRFVERREYELACNWKVFVDNYLDGGYHVNTVHPGLAGVLDYSHYRTEVAGNTAVQISPLRTADEAVGKVRTGDRAYYWWVYPNLMINLYQGVMDTNLVLPLAPNRCRVVFDFYFSAAMPDQLVEDSIAVAHQIQLEDVGVCEEVQRGLGSRWYDTGRFSVRREAAGYHFHRLLAKQLRAAIGS